MRNALLTLVFIGSATSVAFARIGETPDQLVARYGQPLNEVDQKADGAKLPLAKVTFQKGGFQIDVTIIGGVSVEEKFKKLNGKPITLEEARTLLGANAQGEVWNAPVQADGGTTWVRDDNAVAKLGGDGGMVIRSRELTAQEAAVKQTEQHPSLDGF
jgi:hypothetical protein